MTVILGFDHTAGKMSPVSAHKLPQPILAITYPLPNYAIIHANNTHHLTSAPPTLSPVPTSLADMRERAADFIKREFGAAGLRAWARD